MAAEPPCQGIFDISEAQAEAVVEPNGMADDFRRESVSKGLLSERHFSDGTGRRGHVCRACDTGRASAQSVDRPSSIEF